MPAVTATPSSRPGLRLFTLCTAVLWLLAGCANSGGKPPETPAARPDDPSAALADAGVAYGTEDWTRAESHYLIAARGLPADPEPWFKLGNLYYRTGRHDRAARAYEQALQRAPGHAKAWHNLGVVRLHQADASFEHVLNGAEAHDGALDDRAQQMRDILDDAITPTPVGPGATP